jgi:hypothetical protein
LEREEEDREDLARRRLISVLGRQVVANARTLEQKIADAGPANMRIDPHILTSARAKLIEEGVIQRVTAGHKLWYHLGNTPSVQVKNRLETLLALSERISEKNFTLRLGQALEIATYRALVEINPEIEFFGTFPDLDTHDDSKLYSKLEPPAHLGKRVIPGKKLLDFIVRHPDGFYLALECKNVREWMYPDRSEVLDLIKKSLALNCVPVLIARRIPFVTFKLLNAVGVIVHQTYNQLFPYADAELAAEVRNKELLGYHDIKVGSIPDARLSKFIITNMMNVAAEAREKFEAHKDLLTEFVEGAPYMIFAAKVRRRANGQREDRDE